MFLFGGGVVFAGLISLTSSPYSSELFVLVVFAPLISELRKRMKIRNIKVAKFLYL